MAMTTSKQKVSELQRLTNGAGKNLHRRCQLLSEILDDREFIDAEFEGEPAAREHFERQYFSDVAGWCTVDRLVALYREFPNEATWESCHYRLPDMVALYEEAHPRETGTRERTAWKQRATAAEERLEELEAELRVKDRTIAEQAKRIDELQRQVYRLEARLEMLQPAVA